MEHSSIIITSNLLNYQSILESQFFNFLKKDGASAKTRHNYRTDLKHFIQWVFISFQTSSSQLPHDHIRLVRSFSPELLTEYRSSLLRHGTPSATINRRLSALRSFFRFCVLQGWLDQNPIDAIRNVTKTDNKKENPDPENTLLMHFTEYLVREGSSDKTQNNYRTDLRHFIRWVILTVKKSNVPLPASHLDLVRSINPELLDEYISALLKNKIPRATINRRLSAFRSFFRFCILQGWLHQNPADAMRNITKIGRADESIQLMLASFKTKLKKEGLSDKAAGSELTEIKQFLHWVKDRT